jgi:hypothetical protein
LTSSGHGKLPPSRVTAEGSATPIRTVVPTSQHASPSWPADLISLALTSGAAVPQLGGAIVEDPQRVESRHSQNHPMDDEVAPLWPPTGVAVATPNDLLLASDWEHLVGA